jgi:hypothetical protein
MCCATQAQGSSPLLCRAQGKCNAACQGHATMELLLWLMQTVVLLALQGQGEAGCLQPATQPMPVLPKQALGPSQDALTASPATAQHVSTAISSALLVCPLRLQTPGTDSSHTAAGAAAQAVAHTGAAHNTHMVETYSQTHSDRGSSPTLARVSDMYKSTMRRWHYGISQGRLATGHCCPPQHCEQTEHASKF